MSRRDAHGAGSLATGAELREHWNYLAAMARRFRGGRLEPEDLAQEVFERWLRAAPGLAPSISPRAWMTVALRNLAIDGMRRRRSCPAAVGDCAHVPAIEREAAPWWSELEAVDVASMLGALPPALRATFVLFELEGKNYQQISRDLQISKSTVGVRLLRARRRLKQMLTARSGPREPEDGADVAGRSGRRSRGMKKRAEADPRYAEATAGKPPGATRSPGHWPS